MPIRINWNQGKGPRLIRAHQVLDPQPKLCQFYNMKGDFTDFDNLASAEAAMKKNGFTKYKHCKYCWDNIIINPIT